MSIYDDASTPVVPHRDIPLVDADSLIHIMPPTVPVEGYYECQGRGRSRSRSRSPRRLSPRRLSPVRVYMRSRSRHRSRTPSRSRSRSHSRSSSPRWRRCPFRRPSRSRSPASIPAPQLHVPRPPTVVVMPPPPPPIQVPPMSPPSPSPWYFGPPSSSIWPTQVAIPKQLPVDILTFRYDKNMAYAPAAKTYDEAIDNCVELWPELREVDRDRIRLLVAGSDHLVRVPRMTWAAVLCDLPRYEVVHVQVEQLPPPPQYQGKGKGKGKWGSNDEKGRRSSGLFSSIRRIFG